MTENAKAVKITGATDRVYEASPPETVVSSGNRLFTIHRENFKDVVVWNPWTEGAASMGDFEPKIGWKNMVCVEAGNVASWLQIPVGGTWKGSEIIKSHL